MSNSSNNGTQLLLNTRVVQFGSRCQCGQRKDSVTERGKGDCAFERECGPMRRFAPDHPISLAVDTSKMTQNSSTGAVFRPKVACEPRG